MDYMQAYKLLGAYGISTVKSGYVKDADDAVRFSAGKPIVMKVISDRALHKSRSGLVALNLSGEREIGKAFSALSRRAKKFSPYKVLAQQMVPSSGSNIEIIVGGNEDAQFGKLVLLGLGGIYVEAFRDFSLRICPITERDADAMIDELRSGRVIAKDEAHRRVVRSLLMKAARMLERHREIKELDINPVILHGGAYSAVDVRILR